MSTPTQLREILYTDSQDMLALSSTVASRCYKFCTYGSISLRNYISIHTWDITNTQQTQQLALEL
jgi:hypothetical protein